jgi:hypothetical protein
MTVCIAVYSFRSKAIACVTDMMLSTGDMSGDEIAMKSQAWGHRWQSMTAGNDVSPITAVRDRALDSITDSEQKARKITRDDLSRALSASVLSEIDIVNEIELLRPYGLTLATFRDEGAKLGDTTYQQIIYGMGQRRLDIEFLCAGFDPNQTGHIFSVDGRGRVSHYDVAGFWAIGGGQTGALGYLFNSGYRLIDPLEKALFHACYAKFYAEAAPGVGKKTVAFIIRPQHKTQLLLTTELAKLRHLWEQRQKKKISRAEYATVTEILKTLGDPEASTPSTSQKSAGQP